MATAVDRDLIEEGPATGTVKGVLGGYQQNGTVYGWALKTGEEGTAQVSIEVDGVPAATVTANELREDLVAKGISETGNVGFSTNIGQQTSGAQIRAFVEGQELTGSPVTVP